MIIFLDTNIFFNNWHLKNANFKYLFNYASNTGSTILISEVVLAEIMNKVDQETRSLRDVLNKNIEKYQKIINQDLGLKIEVPKAEYDFKKIIKEKTDTVVFYEIGNISNSDLVTRAIKKIKPFQDHDKGFRDTLIWLSFLNYLKSNSINDEILFINNNSTDFYNKDASDLHDELKNDLLEKKISNPFRVFKDLHAFVSLTIDKSKHGITEEEIYQDILYNNEHILESELEQIISEFSPLKAVNLFVQDNATKSILSSVTNFRFKITEGLEDLVLLNYKVLDNNSDVFIELNFNLRIVDIEYTIPTVIYRENYDLLEYQFFNSEEIGEQTKFYDFLRIDLNVTYTFNKKTKDLQGLEINQIEIIK
jgi:hypothetical protein